jgi:hypothetical protein
MKRHVSPLAALACAGTLFTAGVQAHNYTIDFGSSVNDIPVACAGPYGNARGCSTYATLLQSYGDIDGVVDVTTHAHNGGALNWFDKGYNDLYGVAFDNTPSRSSALWVDLVPLNGKRVTLTHFDLGGYYHSMQRDVEVDVFAIGSDQPLYSYRGSIGTSGGASSTGQHTGFDLNLSSTTGIRIQWQDIWNTSNTGIDNIAYSVTASVPEPNSAALLGVGGLLLGAFVRRVRRR